VICVLHALVRLPFSKVKGAKIHFDRCLSAHQDALSATKGMTRDYIIAG
jgi:hypothetical protein